MAVVYIPRHPTAKNVKFFTGLPDILKDVISEEVWNETIREINAIIENSSKIDFYTIAINLLVIPIFFVKNKKTEENLYRYLRYRNLHFIKYGVYICHPIANQYNELRIIINEEILPIKNKV